MIILTESLLKKMDEHARREHPNEACGVLAGKENRVEKAFHCKNVSENPRAHYVISPEEFIQVFNDIEELGLEILGLYH